MPIKTKWATYTGFPHLATHFDNSYWTYIYIYRLVSSNSLEQRMYMCANKGIIKSSHKEFTYFCLYPWYLTDTRSCSVLHYFFLLNTLTFTYIPSTVGCPDTGPQVEPNPEILPGTAIVTWQAAQTSDPVLTTGMLYAVYSLCGSESSSYQLVAEAIEGLSYTVTGLPAPAQCALRVVAYHRYCLLHLDGVLHDETPPFTTAIEGKWREVPP